MADNLTLNAGSGGATLKTDELADLSHVQYIKLMDGTANGTAVIAGDATNGLDVDVTRVSGTVTVDGSGVTQPISAASLPLPTGAATSAAQTTGNNSLSSIDGKLTAGGGVEAAALRVTIASDSTGVVSVDDNGGSLTVDGTVTANLAAGTNAIGRVNPEPQTANGLSIGRLISAATTNATSLKASAGQVYTVFAHNVNAAVRYLKLYNLAAAPTVGTDTPVMTIPIPGNTAGAGVVLDTGGMGIAFGTGIAYATTTGVADSDTAAVAANEIVVHILYK